MSDPVTNVEIEDVLASIRRLVAKDEERSPAGQRSLPPESSPAPVEMAPDATPVEETAKESPSAQPTLGNADEEPLDSESAPFVLTESLRVAKPQVSAPPETRALEETETDFTAPQMTEPMEAAQEHGSEDRSEVAEFVIDAPLGEAPGAVGDEAVSGEDPADRSALLSTIAELEAAVGKGGEDWEMDGSEAAAPADVVWDIEVPMSLNLSVDTLDAVPDAETLGDRPVTLDAPESERREPGPFDATDETGPYDGLEDDPLNDESSSEESADQGPFDADEDDLLAGSEIDDLDIAAAISDEELREMVSEIVRQELQGALGERITRNVRKLVRREIYRILASEEFD